MKGFEVGVELAGYTSLLDMSATLSEEFLAGFNETMTAEGTFPAGVTGVISASVSGDSDDIDDGDAKVFVAVRLKVSAVTEAAAEQLACKSFDLLAGLADVLAGQAGAGLDLERGDLEVTEVTDAENPSSSVT